MAALVHAYKPDGTARCGLPAGKGKSVTQVLYRELCPACRREVAALCRRLRP